MKERLKKLVDNVDDMWVSTIHSMCVRILRRDIGYLGYLPDFTIYDENDKDRILRRIFEDLGLETDKFLKTVKNVISDLPEKMVLNDYCYLAKSQAVLYEKTLNEMMEKISGFTGVNRRGNIFKLITALKQICNHPYQFLKSGGTSKELSGKAEKCVDLVNNIIENGEKT